MSPFFLHTVLVIRHLLHLTDLHLFADRKRLHYDMNPYDSLVRVLDSALRQYQPEAVLLSGDLSQDESAQAYQSLASLFSELSCQVLALPGNHDDLSLMQHHFAAENVSVLGTISIGNWTIVGADCTVPGRVYGEFGRQRLAALDAALEVSGSRPTLLSFHQPPVTCGSAWLDQSMLRDADALCRMLTKHDKVTGIVCGHIHQPLEKALPVADRTVATFTTPSTCRQFAIGHDPFTLGDARPGWRWFHLHDNRLETAVYSL